MKSNLFDLSRFWALLRRDFVASKSQLYSTLFYALFPIFLMLLRGLSSDVFNQYNSATVFLMIVLFISVGSTTAGHFFFKARDSGGLSAYLLLPASPLEKYLSSFLLTTVVLLPISIILFFIGLLVSSLLGGGWNGIYVFFSPELLFGRLSGYGGLITLFFILLHSFAFLFGFLAKMRGGSVMVYTILGFVISVGAVNHFLSYFFDIGFNGIKLILSISDSIFVLVAIVIVLTVVNYALAYLCMTEKGIASPNRRFRR